MKFNSLALLIGLSFLYSCASIKPEAPSVSKDLITPPPSVVSNLNIPVEVDLNPYFLLAEKAVPAQYEGSENPCEGLRYYYQFIRSSFNISGYKDNINLSFEGKYKIKGSYCAKCLKENCLLPSPIFSCGFDESLRRIEIGYSSKIKLLPNYHLSTITTLLKANPIDPCKVGFINFDITDKLLKEVKVQLDILGKNVDSQVQAYNLKPYVVGFWNKLFEVQKVDEFGYLNLNPMAVSVSDLNMNGSRLSMSLGLACTPVFTVGYTPSKPTDLPDLTNNIQQNGFKVYTDLIANYTDLNVLLNNKLSGKEFELKGKKIIINNLQITGLGNSKISVKLDFKGSKKGIVYLVGTPVFDSAKNIITIPDLAFELKSRNVLLKLANWLLNDKITDKIKAEAIFDLSPILLQAKNNLQTQLNRNLADHIQMTGTVNSLAIQRIYTSVDSLLIRVLSNGEIGVRVN